MCGARRGRRAPPVPQRRRAEAVNSSVPGTSARPTRAHTETLDRDGYLQIGANVIFDQSCDVDLPGWVDEVAALPDVPGRWMMYFEQSARGGSRLLSRIENFVDHVPGFSTLVGDRVVERWVEGLVGEPVTLFKDKVNIKWPGSDGFRPHQDAHVWEDLYPGLTGHLTVALAVDRATPENGCLEFAPGCHTTGLLGTRLEEIPAPVADRIPWVSVPLEAGDAVIFGSYAPHRSGPNTSGRRRRMLFLTYNIAREGDLRARYFADKRRNYPPDCERLPGVTYRYKI